MLFSGGVKVEVDGDGVALRRVTRIAAESEVKESAEKSNSRVAPVMLQGPRCPQL